MPLTFPHDCPHCETKKIGFTAAYNWEIRSHPDHKDVLALCNGCNNGVVFRLQLSKHTSEFDFVTKGTGNLSANGIRIVDHYPRRIANAMPEDLPTNVEALYRQALGCIRQETWDSAGMTLRKVLEVSTKQLKPEYSNENLGKRIDRLLEAGLLTEDIKDWAHEIRLDGNSAAHDDELFDRVRAEVLNSFVEAYLRYVYSMPALVTRRRAQRQ